ncbi:MAG: lipocalin-like domain-containing protein [Burkholderiales bacterium]
MNRRQFLAAGIAYPFVKRGYELVFPRDYGAHPDFRQEWWYVTGWLKTNDGRELGFQITFFRARPDIETANPSAFTPRQIILAHAALSDPKHGRLRVDERAARTALDLAGSRQGNTNVWVDDWKLELNSSRYRASIFARDFSLDLEFLSAGKPLLQGENGFSRKGPKDGEASYYYSQSQLKVAGKANGEAVTGIAWLDHEWSSQYMAAGAAGWDWCGLNMNDGSALMAFRMRGGNGQTVFAPPGVSFQPLRTWKSPRSGATYPVSMRVNQYVLEPLMDDQEVDARASVGSIYWEGAVRALQNGREAGRGYLELTGYWKPMKL